MTKQIKEQTAPAPSVKKASAVEAKVRKAIDEWYSAKLANSVVSRDTDVHNLIHNAKPALVQAIVAVVGQTQTQE